MITITILERGQFTAAFLPTNLTIGLSLSSFSMDAVRPGARVRFLHLNLPFFVFCYSWTAGGVR